MNSNSDKIFSIISSIISIIAAFVTVFTSPLFTDNINLFFISGIIVFIAFGVITIFLYKRRTDNERKKYEALLEFLHKEIIHKFRNRYRSYALDNEDGHFGNFMEPIAHICSDHLSSLANKRIFEFIVGEDKHNRFIHGDLKSLGDMYHNTHHGYEEFYNSTMVIPIRAVSHLNKEADILGFFCLDCLENCPEWEKDHYFLHSIAAAIADALYMLMDQKRNYDKRHKPELNPEKEADSGVRV